MIVSWGHSIHSGNTQSLSKTTEPSTNTVHGYDHKTSSHGWARLGDNSAEKISFTKGEFPHGVGRQSGYKYDNVRKGTDLLIPENWMNGQPRPFGERWGKTMAAEMLEDHRGRGGSSSASINSIKARSGRLIRKGNWRWPSLFILKWLFQRAQKKCLEMGE